MKKIILFPLWKIEDLERYLESMEEKGYRLEKTKYSHFFYFKKSTPKQMRYFLSCKSFRGQSMGHCDYALVSKHSASQIKSSMCFYTIYRTKDSREDLSLLYEARLDYIKTKLLENSLTSLFFTMLFLALIFASMVTQSTYKSFYILGAITVVCVFLTIYYFNGYFKQSEKCRKYQRNNLYKKNNDSSVSSSETNDN